jgi:hypothetical protein
MRPTAYLYVVTVCYPNSDNPWLRQNNPEMICRTEEEAKFLVEELGKIATGNEPGDPVIHTYKRVPFLEVPEQFREILS